MAVLPVSRLRGRTVKVSSGYRTADRPKHIGVDLMFLAEPGDEGRISHEFSGNKKWWMPPGVPAVAYDAGVVHTAKQINTGGYVVIEHPGGLTTQYMHLVNVRVRPGQRVMAGQAVGEVGGNPADFPLKHLHFQVRQNGELRDPAPCLRGLPSVDATGFNWLWIVLAVGGGFFAARYVR